MREPPAGPFDVVLNLCSSFGYLGDEEDQRALQAWHDVLVPGGLLVIEGMHRDALVLKSAAGAEVSLGETGAVESGHVDWVTGIAHRMLRLPDGSERRFSPRVYSATELVAMVHGVGFADATVRGRWDGRPFDPESRLLLTARCP